MATKRTLPSQSTPAASPLDGEKRKLVEAIKYRATHQSEADKTKELFETNKAAFTEAQTKFQQEMSDLQQKFNAAMLEVDRANQVINTLAGTLQAFGIDLSQPLFPDEVQEAVPEPADPEALYLEPEEN